MNDFISQDERRLREDRERKKAEVRARLEAQALSKKKGFMTPERKKKLRSLLRRNAAEQLKQQQEVKAAERRKTIAERTGSKQNFDIMSENELKDVCRRMHERLVLLENTKWDMESETQRKELDVHEQSMQVSDMRGKFVKPPLKRVPKYSAKIEKMLLNARKEVGFTVTLKSVKKDQFKVDELKDTKDHEPEWSWKKKADGNESSNQLSTPTATHTSSGLGAAGAGAGAGAAGKAGSASATASSSDNDE